MNDDLDDALDDLAPGLADDNARVMLVGDDGEARTMAELLGMLPVLRDPAHATALAEAVNHLSHGSEYRVIADPAAYAERFRARLARENPAQPFREGLVQVSDFGIPDFGAITPPVLEGEVLRFFAENALLGVPYAVELPGLTAEPSYEPMPLKPVPGAGTDAPEEDEDAGPTEDADVVPDTNLDVEDEVED